MSPQSVYRLLLITLAASLLCAGCNKSPQQTVMPSVVPATTAYPSTSPVLAASAAGAQVSDRDVTEHVKTALQRSELLRASDITVVTLKGDVRLIGVLNSQKQIDEAIRIARAADGTHSIHDELTLKK